MWKDTDIPLAYLITFRCYGTWLHGDERMSIDLFTINIALLESRPTPRGGGTTNFKSRPNR